MKKLVNVYIDLRSMGHGLRTRAVNPPDHARKALVIDIGELTSDEVEVFLGEYCEAFRKHWANRNAQKSQIFGGVKE